MSIFMLFPLLLLGDGHIIPIPPRPPGPKPLYIDIKSQHAEVRIVEGVAAVEIEEVFYNPHEMRIEGEYIFPIPEGASLSDFSMWVNGKEVKGEILRSDEARRRYLEIVRRRRDPALLEYYNRDMFRCRIFPIEPHGEVRVKIGYEQVLKKKGDMYEFRYPLKINSLTEHPMESFSLHATIEASWDIKNVFSPTHSIDVVPKDKNKVEVAIEENNIRPNSDVIFYYSASREEFDMSLLTYRKGKDGYFLLSLSGGYISEDKENKAIIFVLDRSGSMRGRKIEQAKEALEFMVNSLNKGDEFAIITFSTDVEVLGDGLMGWRDRERALSGIRDINAGGGTNIEGALLRAAELANKVEKLPVYVVFLTDGEPTVGERNPERLKDKIKKEWENGRLFVFGVGYDVNTELLELLTGEFRGRGEYVTPDEDLEIVLSSFFSSIQTPVLTDVEIDYGKIKVKKVHPEQPGDLFAGSSITIAGMYENPGKTTITVKGKRKGREVVYEERFEFPGESEEYAFVPRVWARRRIGYLLSQIKRYGESRELVDEVTELGKRFGIVTPYTSYLITDEEERRLYAPGVFRAEKGEGAVRIMKDVAFAKRAITGTPQRREVKVIGEKTFYMKGEVWVDTEYKEGMKEKRIELWSREYEKFMESHPELVPYLALGKVIVVWKGVAYRFE